MTIPQVNIRLVRLQEKYLPVNDGGRFGYAGFEQAGELLGKHRRAEIVPLRLVTLVSLKKHQLFLLFHAPSNDLQHASRSSESRLA